MKREHEDLPSGKRVLRKFHPDGTLASETHSYGLVEIACELAFVSGKKVAETYLVNKRLVGRARYEKARAKYPDMPAADPTMPDTGAELTKLAGRETKQKAAANKRRLENPLSDEQQREAERQIPIFEAAGRPDVAALRRFLDAGEDPNSIALGRGFTLLYKACTGGDSTPAESLAAVRLLLERGADPNQRFEFDSRIDGRLERGLTALMVASTAEIAQELLNAGAEAADEHGRTPLMRAAGTGRVEVVKLLLSTGADPDALTSKAQAPGGHAAADFARAKLEFFTENIEGTIPDKAQQRIDAYREVLRLLNA
jgi:hypothetical protein